MKINLTIQYFGMIRELTALGEEVRQIEKGTSIKQLIHHLNEEYKGLSEKVFRIAVNNQMVTSDTPLNQHCTIAIMPPFAGG